MTYDVHVWWDVKPYSIQSLTMSVRVNIGHEKCGDCAMAQVGASATVRWWRNGHDSEEEEKAEAKGDSDADRDNITTGSPASSAAEGHSARRAIASPGRSRHGRHPGLVARPAAGHRWRVRRLGQSVPRTDPLRVGADDEPQDRREGHSRESVGDRH